MRERPLSLLTSLNNAGIYYMFTGGIVASYYGTPITTMDADIKIFPPNKIQPRAQSFWKKKGSAVEWIVMNLY